MLCADISESRMATKARPVGERSRFRIARVRADGHGQAQEIELDVAVQRPAEHRRVLDVHAGIAAGDRFPARQPFFDDEAEGQRGDAQVDALDAQRRHADDDADDGRQPAGTGQRQRKGPAGVVQHGLRVGAHAQERGMADRELPGEARPAASAPGRRPNRSARRSTAPASTRAGSMATAQEHAEQRVPEGLPAMLDEAMSCA